MISTDVPRQVYLLVDGENIDRTLGQILGTKPKSNQRPRWDSLKKFVEKKFDAVCRPLFFLNATQGTSGPFIQALKTVGFLPIPLTSNDPTVKVVDEGILKTLDALKEKFSGARSPAVVLVSHDADFKEKLNALSDRPIGIVAFKEYLSGEYELIPSLQVFDLEDDAVAFSGESGPLPRLRNIPIEMFDPYKFI